MTHPWAGGGARHTVGKCGDRWTYAVGASTEGFQSISFVNNIRTRRGGTHVGTVQRQVVKAIHDHITQRHPKLGISSAAVR